MKFMKYLTFAIFLFAGAVWAGDVEDGDANKITEYIKLLVPKEGSLENLTYQEIDEEFTLQTQLEIVEKITEVIQPGYKETRKN